MNQLAGASDVKSEGIFESQLAGGNIASHVRGCIEERRLYFFLPFASVQIVVSVGFLARPSL